MILAKQDRFFLALLLVTPMLGIADELATMYERAILAQEKPRLERKINEIWVNEISRGGFYIL